jgi:hypothetical protein
MAVTEDVSPLPHGSDDGPIDAFKLVMRRGGSAGEEVGRMKLFMFYVGGDCGNSNVELHDVRFSVGQTPEDCFEDLRRQWWGEPDSLHLDCWGAVEQADGYDLELSTTPPAGAQGKLFFVNLGGYDPERFSELHENILIVAADASAAKDKAKARIRHWRMPHKDRLFEIEKAVDVSSLMQIHGYHLILRPATHNKPFEFKCDYLPIGRRETSES